MQVPLIAFESGLGCLVLGGLVWELVLLRREQARDRLEAEARRADAAKGDAAGETSEPRR